MSLALDIAEAYFIVVGGLVAFTLVCAFLYGMGRVITGGGK
jgi:hypothetical protein